jgi:protein-S-isoprenylcysteine O-methyltransferase Ste14
MRNQIIAGIASTRVVASRIMGVLIVLLALFTAHSFGEGTFTNMLLETSGLFLLTICSMGRLWALIFISGYKSQKLITDGPYSITRNPLYLFSMLGALGMGLASENVLILAILLIFYLFYYPFTILAEEHRLTDKFEQEYIDYAKRTPRFFPKFSLYKKPGPYQINADTFVRNLVDGTWFIWIYILFNFLEMLQTMKIVPVLLRVP